MGDLMEQIICVNLKGPKDSLLSCEKSSAFQRTKVEKLGIWCITQNIDISFNNTFSRCACLI